nr:HNH endonuclease [Leptolyngbya sp. 'hensonii']
MLKWDGHACQYCGSTKKLTLDHVIPKSKGGLHSWDNVVTACEPCNLKKGDKLLLV